MSEALLDRFIRQYLDMSSGSITFIWHGGEPLLAGLRFFGRIVELQDKYRRAGQRITNTVQTNGTLVTDAWAAFFKEHDFKVGVSIDGDRISHNPSRVTSEGRGTFDDVIAGVSILRRHGLTPGFIQTLTRHNVMNVTRDFSFFDNQLGTTTWGVNACLFSGSDSPLGITNAELACYLKACIDLWLTFDRPDLEIREVENFVAGVMGKRAGTCTFNGSCTRYFCLDYDGRVYPCDRFSGRDDLLLGDLAKQELVEILTGPARACYVDAVNSAHADCVACPWWAACHNGCTHHRVNGISGKYYYCGARKGVFAYIKSKIENEHFRTDAEPMEMGEVS